MLRSLENIFRKVSVRVNKNVIEAFSRSIRQKWLQMSSFNILLIYFKICNMIVYELIKRKRQSNSKPFKIIFCLQMNGRNIQSFQRCCFQRKDVFLQWFSLQNHYVEIKRWWKIMWKERVTFNVWWPNRV